MTKRRMRIQFGLGGVVTATVLLGLVFVRMPQNALNSADISEVSHSYSGDFDHA